MNNNFEYITNLQYKVKSLISQVKAFESGEKYATMYSEFKKQLSAKDLEVSRLKHDLADAHSQIVTARRNWMQVLEDMEIEHEKELKKKDSKIKKLEERVFEVEGMLDSLRDKLKEKNIELYRVMTELEEEKGKNQELRAQINRDYENSSIPSSMQLNPKKIPNNREKTDKKPGGQPGHKGHKREKHIPTNQIHIPAPEKYANNSDYKPTGKIITKQLINLIVSVTVDEYNTPEFRNIRTGQRVHADFPSGLVNEVTYGGSVKAFAFLLNTRCYVSIDKVREFLSELTQGELQISKGMINGLCKEFSKKTQAEQKEAFSSLLLSPVLNTDFTAARLNGKNIQVAVCANPSTTMYFARDKKGHEGVKGTPVENYQGILVHDHDKTFYNYGNEHQECLSHVLRYLKDSIDNEPNLKWNKQMRELIQEMIHYRNNLEYGIEINPEKIAKYENRYLHILDIAKEEYEYEPPSNYYKEGYNLSLRLLKYKESHLLFLHNTRVPTNNNLAERLLRMFKRKQKQVMTFRSKDSIHYLCNSMGMISLARAKDENLYTSISSIFD
jgi:hypothetical protein